MDDKYASSGKFAGRLMEHPASSRPSLAPKSEKDIPKITTGSTGEGAFKSVFDIHKIKAKAI